MVLEPVFKPTEVVDDDGCDKEDDNIVVTNVDNEDMQRSGVVFWSGRACSKAFGACPSLVG